MTGMISSEPSWAFQYNFGEPLIPLKHLKLGAIYTGNIYGGKGYPGRSEKKKDRNLHPTSKLFGNASASRDKKSDDEQRITEITDWENLIMTGGFSLKGAVVKHPEQRKRALEYIDLLKQTGKKIGQNILSTREKSSL
jgi:hypothetical protein